MSDAPAPTRAEEGREIIAELERELGVTGTANVFRKALAIAKEAAAIARVRQETYAADQLVERLRSWGENDADPEFFTGDLLSGVLMDCGMGSEAIVAANLRAAQAEAEVARLTQEKDEALCLAEGPSTLLDLARGSVSRGMELYAAEAEVARLTATLTEAEATASLLHKDNERLRWRHPAVLPDWNDLPDGLRAKLARAADGYDPDWGSDLAVNMYAALRQAMMEDPHADK